MHEHVAVERLGEDAPEVGRDREVLNRDSDVATILPGSAIEPAAFPGLYA
jgi:hypothetical protein